MKEDIIQIFTIYQTSKFLFNRSLSFWTKSQAQNTLKRVSKKDDYTYILKKEYISTADLFISDFNLTESGGWLQLPTDVSIGVFNYPIKMLKKEWYTEKLDTPVYCGGILNKERLLKWKDSLYYKPCDQSEIEGIITAESYRSDQDFKNKNSITLSIFRQRDFKEILNVKGSSTDNTFLQVVQSLEQESNNFHTLNGGAIVVRDSKIITSGWNKTTKDSRDIVSAVTQCIVDTLLIEKDLSQCTLYVSYVPNSTELSLIHTSKIKRVVYLESGVKKEILN